MCLLSFYPPGAMPDEDTLAYGASNNDDGHGFALVANNRIITQRGMNADTMIAAFAVARREYPHGPALFHSRLATGGAVNIANCHPFRIGGDKRTVLAHNGVLAESVQPQKKDTRCDTRIAAEELLPSQPFGSLDAPRDRKRFARWLTPVNKVVILTVDRSYARHSYVLNEDHGLWEDGIWYSNTSFDPLDPEFGEALSPDLPVADRCGLCGAIETIDPLTRMCSMCTACADCGEVWEYCDCYLSADLISSMNLSR